MFLHYLSQLGDLCFRETVILGKRNFWLQPKLNLTVCTVNMESSDLYTTIIASSAEIAKFLAVGEIAAHHSHNHFTIGMDLERTRVVWVSKERAQETLDQFFKELKGLGKGITSLLLFLEKSHKR